MIAAAGFGGFCVQTCDTAITAVIGIVAMDVDAHVLFIHCAKRFRRIWAR